MTEDSSNYKKLLTEIIQKQIVILGPDISLMKARAVPGLQVEPDGTVTKMEGNASDVLRRLIDEYVSLSGLIVKSTMEPLLAKYPEISEAIVNHVNGVNNPLKT